MKFAIAMLVAVILPFSEAVSLKNAPFRHTTLNYAQSLTKNLETPS